MTLWSCWKDCRKGDLIYSDRNVTLNNLFYGADRFRAVLRFERMMQAHDNIWMMIEEAVLKVTAIFWSD